MITLNRKADIFIFPENRIVALLNGKITEIKGNDIWFIEKLFRNAYRNLLYMSEAIELAEGREKSSSVKKIIYQFKKLGIIVEAKKKSFSAPNSFIMPYMPLFLSNDIWCCRRGEKFYFFQASDREEAGQRIKDFALSWIWEEGEVNLFLNIISQKFKCLAGQFLLPENKSFIKTKLSKTVKAVIFDSKKNKYSVVQNSFPPIRATKFWSELTKRAVGELGLVPILEKVRMNNIPFEMRRYGYITSHKLTDLDGKIKDFQIGTDGKINIAKGKAIMESLERYCGRKRIDSNFLTFASFRELNYGEAISPWELAEFNNYQFTNGWLKRIKAFNPEKIIPWVKARDVLSGATKKLPLDFASFAPKMSDYGYPRCFFTNSSGMAAHTKLDEAIKKGALEIIERDAILIHWFNKIKPKKIILDGNLDYVRSLSANLGKIGYELYLADLTLDAVPVAMAMAVKENGEFPFFSGAAASERKIDAIKKAAEELEFTIWSRLKYHNELRQRTKSISLETISDPADHEALYLKPGMFKHLKFLIDGPSYQISDSELCSKTDLYSVLNANGFKLYYTDMTAREIEQLGLGIKVVRAIIPGFAPITFGYGQEPLGMKRIYKVPVKLGLRSKEITEVEIINNYLPHFFS